MRGGYLSDLREPGKGGKPALEEVTGGKVNGKPARLVQHGG
jgi:hypothetical protein